MVRVTLVRGPEAAMAGIHPWKTWATWQGTGDPGTGPGSVTLASLVTFSLSIKQSSLSLQSALTLLRPENCHILLQLSALSLCPLIVYSFGLFGGGIQGFI